MSDEEKRPEGESPPGEASAETQASSLDAQSPAEEGARVVAEPEVEGAATPEKSAETDEGEQETTTRSRAPTASELAEAAADKTASEAAADKTASPTSTPVATRPADTTGSGVAPLADHPPTLATGEHDHHGHGHVAPMSLMLGVLGALIILTVMTVAVTMVDLGSQGNFVVAMVIATVKAALVMGYFMHLVWDSKVNVVLFLSSFLFVILFLAMALLDRQEYQQGIDDFAETQALQAQ